MKQLKVIHVSSSVFGGAGIAAQRLNHSLIQLGVESKLITLSPAESDSQIQIRRSIFQLILGKMNSFLAGLISTRTFFSIFSMKSISIREIQNHLSPHEGVIHIHNWFNLISEKTIFRLIKEGYRIILTLHDERLFTGGCHYTLNCRQFEVGCHRCPEVSRTLQSLPRYVFSKNLARISKLDRQLEIIAPSNWIAGEARRSTLLRNANIHVIPNSLNDFNLKIHQETSFSKVNKNSNIIRLGVASKDPYSYIKGGDLIEAMRQDVEFNSHFSLIFMADYSEDEKENFWGQIDFLLVASRIDNSPNVIHEAKSLGIPVIGTNVGGIPELLTPPDLLIEVSNLSKNFFLNLKSNLRVILEKAAESQNNSNEFNEWSIKSASLHLDLYNRLLN